MFFFHAPLLAPLRPAADATAVVTFPSDPLLRRTKTADDTTESPLSPPVPLIRDLDFKDKAPTSPASIPVKTVPGTPTAHKSDSTDQPIVGLSPEVKGTAVPSGPTYTKADALSRFHLKDRAGFTGTVQTLILGADKDVAVVEPYKRRVPPKVFDLIQSSGHTLSVCAENGAQFGVSNAMFIGINERSKSAIIVLVLSNGMIADTWSLNRGIPLKNGDLKVAIEDATRILTGGGTSLPPQDWAQRNLSRYAAQKYLPGNMWETYSKHLGRDLLAQSTKFFDKILSVTQRLVDRFTALVDSLGPKSS